MFFETTRKVGMVFVIAAAGLCFVSLMLSAQPAVPTPDEKPDDKSSEVEFREVPKLGVTVPCKVLSVTSGNTVKVEVRFTLDIQLLDCYPPEAKGEFKEAGIRACENLKRIAVGQPGTVHIPLTTDSLTKAMSGGRVLGEVRVNGDSLAYLQVRKGVAGRTQADGEELLETLRAKEAARGK
jgi:hypothetical protein